MTATETTTVDPEMLIAASRRGGLTAWGVVLIVVGCLAALANADTLMKIASGIERSLSGPSRGGRPVLAPDWTQLLSIAISLALSATLVAAGIGACQARRWCRPIVLVICGFVIGYGLWRLVGLAIDLPHQLDVIDADVSAFRGDQVPTQTSVILLFLLRAGLASVLSIVLPYSAYRFFSNPATAATLDAADPRTVWTDRLPVRVLGWTAFLLIEAIGAALSLHKPALPLFITAIVGQPAMIATSVCIVLLLWCAWLTFRLDRTGWLVGFVLVALLQLGGTVFFLTGGTRADLMSDWLGRPALQRPETTPQSRQHAVVVNTPAWELDVTNLLATAMILGFGIYVSPAIRRQDLTSHVAAA